MILQTCIPPDMIGMVQLQLISCEFMDLHVIFTCIHHSNVSTRNQKMGVMSFPERRFILSKQYTIKFFYLIQLSYCSLCFSKPIIYFALKYEVLYAILSSTKLYIPHFLESQKIFFILEFNGHIIPSMNEFIQNNNNKSRMSQRFL